MLGIVHGWKSCSEWGGVSPVLRERTVEDRRRMLILRCPKRSVSLTLREEMDNPGWVWATSFLWQLGGVPVLISLPGLEPDFITLNINELWLEKSMIFWLYRRAFHPASQVLPKCFQMQKILVTCVDNFTLSCHITSAEDSRIICGARSQTHSFVYSLNRYL